ncbi:hypothetical protein CY35_16G090000 [Sphagnum magellanicum]|nr:hypothetical protein CY35_16G090000 [Sphagnum magellanicum]
MSKASCSSDPVVTVVIDIPKKDPVNEDEVKARHLFDIRADKNLNWLLDDWQKQFKVARDRIETKTTRTNNAKNDLYQWIGFFIVFQGVVLTAVAQSSTLGCQQSWAPAALSFIASLATVVSVHFKLVNYRELNASLLKETHQSQVLHDQLAELRANGKKFHFSWFDTRSKGKQVFKGLNDFFYWAAISALVVFSAIILLCCILVLCGPHRHKLGT